MSSVMLSPGGVDASGLGDSGPEEDEGHPGLPPPAAQGGPTPPDSEPDGGQDALGADTFDHELPELDVGVSS